MTRDDIIRMAREQGDFMPGAHGDAFIFNADPEGTYNVFKFATLVAAAERETCLSVLMPLFKTGDPNEFLLGYNEGLADADLAIRARGDA